MPAKIDIDALKIFKNQEQMRLNIGKKLKTASLNSRFTGCKKEKRIDLLTFENFLVLRYKFTHQQPQGCFTSFKKIVLWKKLFLFHIDPKIHLNSVVHLLIIISCGIC